jgi:uncharacterized protein
MAQASLHFSATEHSVFEQVYNIGAVSTELISTAIGDGLRIGTDTNTVILPQTAFYDPLPAGLAWGLSIQYNGGMQGKCPVCASMVVWEENPYRPFCSERCKLIDLGQWITGAYRVALKDSEEKHESPKESNGSPGHRQEG